MTWFQNSRDEMDVSFDVATGVSTVVGAVVGGLGMAFRWGRHDGMVALKVDNLQNTMTLVCDELARRVTVLENRVQYDGYYTNPRIARRDQPE
jgi:hypothetical protein